jgi:hypothetical protein
MRVAQGRHINVDDAVLVQRWLDGDAAALDRLIGKYQGRLI